MKNETKKYKQVVVPFDGFYHSYADMYIDSALESEEQYLQELGASEEETERMTSEFLYNDDMQTKICKDYLIYFGEEYGIDFEFVELDSPAFYNFRTDVLIAKIPEKQALEIHDKVMTQHYPQFAKLVKEKFTSCDGFISFYPNDAEIYRNFDECDENVFKLLIEVYILKNEYSYHDNIEDCILYAYSDMCFSKYLHECEAYSVECNRLFERYENK